MFSKNVTIFVMDIKTLKLWQLLWFLESSGKTAWHRLKFEFKTLRLNFRLNKERDCILTNPFGLNEMTRRLVISFLSTMIFAELLRLLMKSAVL